VQNTFGNTRRAAPVIQCLALKSNVVHCCITHSNQPSCSKTSYVETLDATWSLHSFNTHPNRSTLSLPPSLRPWRMLKGAIMEGRYPKTCFVFCVFNLSLFYSATQMPCCVTRTSQTTFAVMLFMAQYTSS
jgi:hypothetical protein